VDRKTAESQLFEFKIPITGLKAIPSISPGAATIAVIPILRVVVERTMAGTSGETRGLLPTRPFESARMLLSSRRSIVSTPQAWHFERRLWIIALAARTG
jgi:hypothetical protein